MLEELRCMTHPPTPMQFNFSFFFPLENVLSLPPRRLQIVNPFGWMIHCRILVLGLVRIGIKCLLQVAEGVIHLAVLGFVSPDVKQQVTHLALVLGHLPILHCDLWCFQIGPFRQFALLDFLNGAGVGDDRFFFEVADEAVTGARRDQVGDEEAVEEDALGPKDHQTHEPAWFGEFEEGQQVHTFVERLF